ncbi:hypothetical protein V5799_024426, partial [Amblyomma americanum]
MNALMPGDWKRSRFRAVQKSSGDDVELNSGRPIIITPVLHRLTVQIIEGRLQRWAKRKCALESYK